MALIEPDLIQLKSENEGIPQGNFKTCDKASIC